MTNPKVTKLSKLSGGNNPTPVTFKVGTRYTVTLTLRPAKPGTVVAATCEWSPCVPQSLTETEIKDYRLGVKLAVETLSRSTGRQPILRELS